MARSGSLSVCIVLISGSSRNTHSMVYGTRGVWLHQRRTAWRSGRKVLWVGLRNTLAYNGKDSIGWNIHREMLTTATCEEYHSRLARRHCRSYISNETFLRNLQLQIYSWFEQHRPQQQQHQQNFPIPRSLLYVCTPTHYFTDALSLRLADTHRSTFLWGEKVYTNRNQIIQLSVVTKPVVF